MFSPLAYTLGFALLGALIFTLTLVPVMSSMLLKKNVREKNNRFVHFINQKCTALFDTFYAHRKLTIGLATVVCRSRFMAFLLPWDGVSSSTQRRFDLHPCYAAAKVYRWMNP